MSDLEQHRRAASMTLGAYCLPGPEMVALLDKIERLTAALRAILESNWDIDAMPHEIWQQARRALEGK